MEIKLLIRCSDGLRKKAAYVFDTFFRTMGLPYSIVNSENEIGRDAVVIYYGQKSHEPRVSSPTIAIRGSNEADQYFKERKIFDAREVKKFDFRGADCYSLFHNDEFLANSGNAIVENGNHFEINVDLVSSAFFFLSCWQEFDSSALDRFRRFPSTASLQHQLGIVDRPIVNEYFRILKYCLGRADPRLANPSPAFRDESFAVCLTHDIDYIRKWTPAVIYREVVKYLVLNTERKGFAERRERFKKFLSSFVLQNDPYRNSIEKILETEQEFHASSTFFFKTAVTSRRDVGYSARSKSFKDLVGRIENIGHEIGLHPSFNTYKNKGCMRREKGRLEKVVSGRLLGVRQHYLRFEVPTTWRIQEELGFLYDASLGFADREGFRSGFCSPFHPYDVEKDEQLEIWELPLTVMDGTLKDYRGFSAEESLEVLTRTVDTLKAYDGVGVFLFHNTCFDEFDFPGWDRVFQKTLEYAFDQGAYIGSCKDILDKYIGFSDVRKRNFS